jgi:hypothetical protein
MEMLSNVLEFLHDNQQMVRAVSTGNVWSSETRIQFHAAASLLRSYQLLTQKIPSILWNPKVHRRVHKRPPLVPVFRQTNVVHIRPSYFSKICFNIIFHLCLGLPHSTLYSLRYWSTVTFMECDYRRVLDWWPDNWTVWYSAWIHFTVHYYTHTDTSVHSDVFTNRCLVAASNGERYPSSRFPKSPLSQILGSHNSSSQRLNLSSSLFN